MSLSRGAERTRKGICFTSINLAVNSGMPVQTSVSGAIATVVFGGTKGNSLPGALLRELAGPIEQTAARDDVKVIVLRSEGDGPFCAGASFDELKSIADETAGKAFFLGFAGVI